jgi:hypothetical protein
MAEQTYDSDPTSDIVDSGLEFLISGNQPYLMALLLAMYTQQRHPTRSKSEPDDPSSHLYHHYNPAIDCGGAIIELMSRESSYIIILSAVQSFESTILKILKIPA